MKDAYLTAIIDEMPRLLSQLDTNPLSPTYGCFDRQYWHYKTSDMPCARYQEAGLTLALISRIASPKNIYYKDEQMIRFAVASVSYWSKIQESDGSYNEWYPNERSFVATAFSLFAVTEVYLLFPHRCKQYTDAIVRAANWLCNQTELSVCNQQAGASAALYNAYRITADSRYKTRAEKNLKQLIHAQTPEGWFPEYGGADVGYSSVTIDYLANYYKKSKDKQVLPVAEKLLNFLDYFVHPGYTWGGIYGSRNTQYMIPGGMEIFSQYFPAAQRLSQSVLSHLRTRSLIVDDRYLCYNGYTYLYAYLHFSSHKRNDFLYTKSFIRHFPQAGLLITSNKRYYAICNLKKGGVAAIYSQKNGKLIFNDCGLIGRLENNTVVSTQFLNMTIMPRIQGRVATITGPMYRVTSLINTPGKQLLMRCFQLILGRVAIFSKLSKKLLRVVLITGGKKVPISYEKTFIFSDRRVNITTTVHMTRDSLRFRQLWPFATFMLIYVPSSRYYLQIASGFTDNTLSQHAIDTLNTTRKIVIKHDVVVT